MKPINIETIDQLSDVLEGMVSDIEDLKSKDQDTDRLESDVEQLSKKITSYRNYLGSPADPARGMSEEQKARGGRLLKAIVSGKLDLIQKYGGEVAKESDLADKLSKDMVGKAGLGTEMTSDATTGSYVVPTEYFNQVIRAAAESSVMLPLIRQFPMARRIMYIPVKSTGATLTWVSAQGTSLTETSPTFDQKTMTAYTLASWIAFNESFFEDEDAAVMDYFVEEFGADFADEVDNQVLNGTGTPMTGVFQDGSANVVTMGSGNSSFEDIDYTDLLDLINGVTYKKYQRNGTFICHPSVMHIIRKLNDANGRPFLAEPTAGNPASIGGYPILTSDAAPSTDAASTKFVAFGNWRHFAWGNRRKMDVKYFGETSYAVNEEEVFIRARGRFGGVNMIPAAFAVLQTSA